MKKKTEIVWEPDDKIKVEAHAKAKGLTTSTFINFALGEQLKNERQRKKGGLVSRSKEH